jgi:immune inhibitor A
VKLLLGGILVKKGKWVSAALAAMLSCSTFASVSAAPVNVLSDVNASSVEEKSHKHTGGPFDLAVANDERLIEMLKKNGQISKNASEAEAQAKLQQYLKNKEEHASSLPKGELADEQSKKRKDIHSKHKKEGLKHGGKKEDKIKNVKEEKWKGGQRVDNVLVLLVEYPDFPATNITSEETDMFYDEYTKEHYEDMIFGKKGYEGPNGEKLISVKQYYEQQSGGSYSITGKVGGWYKAQHPAAYYGGNDPETENDKDARSLVKEALNAAAKDPNINLGEFDQEDRYDLDSDGNTREPDGLVDHLMIVHSSVGEEAGGGSLGGDAIWSHRWNLDGVYPIEGTESEVDYWDGSMAAYDYTIEPADGAAGVFAHEYGHDLELPDEYDTQYSGAGEPVAYWSIMSSGSWAGKIPGTEPTGFSAWSKEFLQSYVGGNWLSGETFVLDEINRKGIDVLLDQANTKGTNNDAVRVDLPEKETIVNEPFSGEYQYFSGKGNDLDNSMVTTLDLTDASSVSLDFKTWYDIETDWDYASVQVKEEGSNEWVALEGNLTTDTDPYHQNPGHGITGSSNGEWVDGAFNLSAYAGKKIELKLNYWTDGAAVMPGFFVDDVSINVDGSQQLFDDAEGESAFTLEGFTKNQGKFYSDHYYLLEWRNHQGVDEGLAHIARGNSLMSYDGGLVVWYVDNKYTDNWTGIHPGEGFLGVVDANQETLKWSDGVVASTRYQVHDAAFNTDKGQRMFLDYKNINGTTLSDNAVHPNPVFNDKDDYSNPGLVDAGRNVPEYGLKFEVVGKSKDDSVAKIKISRK